MNKAKLYQDNMVAIILKNNERALSSSRTKHIEIRYVFIQYQIEKNNNFPKYCHTKTMVANFMTKPLQGGGYSGLDIASWGCQIIQEVKIISEG